MFGGLVSKIATLASKITTSVPTKGSLWIWGFNTYGQLGQGNIVELSSPVQVGTDTNWSKLSGGREFFVAINNVAENDNRLWSWGRNYSGQLGLGNTTSRSSPVQVGTDTNWSNLSAANNKTFAIKSTGTLWAWGSNSYGDLGLGNTTSRSSPVQVGVSTDWANVASSSYASFAIKTSGTLWSWGKNTSYGLLGSGNTSSRSSPVQIGTDTNWSKVFSKFSHALAIKTDGTLWAWGRNAQGQLGLGNTTSRSSPVQVGTDTNWASVATAEFATLAIKTTGSLWAWGNNSGILGLGDTTNRSSPVQVGTSTDWSHVSTSSDVAIARKTNGTLWVWGNLRSHTGLGIVYTGSISERTLASTSNNWEHSGMGLNSTIFSIDKTTSGTIWAQGNNSSGQFGNGTTTSRSSPVQIGTDTDWSIVRCGGNFSVGRKTNGTLWSWGGNAFGQLGQGNLTNRSSPVQIGTGTNWSANFTCGFYHCIAVKSDGTMWSWGNAQDFALGNGDNNTRLSSPVQVGSGSSWSYVTTNQGSTALALKTDGTLWGWGPNTYGQVGNNSTTITTRSSPVQLGTDSDWSQVSIGQRHGLAVKSTGAMWVWGSASDSGFGTGNVSSPIQVGSSTDWSKAQASRQFSMALKTTGTLWAWGSNTYGQLGSRNNFTYSSPKQIGTDTNWSSNFNCGARHSVAIRTTGTLWTWGRATEGQLGIGSTTPNRSSPTQVGTDTDWSSLGTGFAHTMAIKTNGTLWAWGRNLSGELGLGNTTNRSSPVQVGTDTNWSSVSSGSYFSLAIKTTGTLWSWGVNTYGQLGSGNTTSRSSPVQIGTATDWTFCKAGRRSSFAVKTTGTLWAWGRNVSGELGLNDSTNRSSPVQIGTNTDWSTVSDNISPNDSASIALRNNSNNIFVFGYNLQGQLGVGLNAVVSPVQIGTDTNWSKIDVGNHHSAAIKTTGTLWTWGRNQYGQLGHNNTTNRSSPVQVGSATDWVSVKCGYNHTLALKTSGTLWAFGRNSSYQLGNKSPIARSSPVPVGSDSDWASIFAKRNFSKAIKTNGTLWSWGENGGGGNMILRLNLSSPVQLGSDSTWILPESSQYRNTSALKS